VAMQVLLKPIGTVYNSVTEPVDDVWQGLVSRIDLDAGQFTPECLAGLDEFSHVEIVFVFDRVEGSEIQTKARRPRGNPAWPMTGIFAQRGKNRPNRIGVSVCRLRSVEGLSIWVEELDAIDGTPVLDIKPHMREFEPRGEIRQPAWASELMAGYWGRSGKVRRTPQRSAPC
jgi:tRNA (adenine37-N6)-methyltransferase